MTVGDHTQVWMPLQNGRRSFERGSQRAGAPRAARGAHEGHRNTLTLRDQGGAVAASNRRRYAEKRIAAARHPWTEFLRAADWLTSELKQLAEHDPGRAASIATDLRTQTRAMAEKLNTEDAERRTT
ncbi:hypothetical protein [Nonomuraea diastatica]|uniref:Uncharacterized protein n=1 Tax=Nonomuraea diastatica TaxID=1848329 RepID=A0A4R4WHN2_9ACTN|nr:hypothetical protein [Nonomuraea diastatica]TDD15055.1 hypothetical protein E1294_35680 [Nonomuraea diastatica]